MEEEIDYRIFYDSEKYLLEKVGSHFQQTGELEPADFYSILIWKAERAKNHHKKRLATLGGSFDKAVRELASTLYRSTSDRNRLECLMNNWWFALPTASAILTILYPDVFTVYDWRVCDELGIPPESWHSRGFSEELWNHYLKFKEAVIQGTPANLSLRDKDRFLIGRSTHKSIVADSKD